MSECVTTGRGQSATDRKTTRQWVASSPRSVTSTSFTTCGVSNNPYQGCPFVGAVLNLSSEHYLYNVLLCGTKQGHPVGRLTSSHCCGETLVQWGLHDDIFCLFMQLMKTCSLDKRPETQPGRRMDGIQPCIIQVGEWKPVSPVSTPKWYSGCGYVSS